MDSTVHENVRALGARWTGSGAEFSVFSNQADRVELCLLEPSGAVRSIHEMSPHGHVWHVALGEDAVSLGERYAFRAHGPHAPQEGLRMDGNALLVDPHARAVTDETPPRSCIVDPHFDWGADQPPATPWRDSFIYELHVKGFTQGHPRVPEELRGTYLGLVDGCIIEYLQSLGVTAVELLPVQAFADEPALTARGLTNYWGYNSVAWFAPTPRYARLDAVREFKQMVKALHAAHIEVILDVVFNHTAEGDEMGPLYHMRGLANSVYYRLQRDDKARYENFSGCGNTVNCSHARARQLIIECLKFWVEEMHVDGFRFDLAPVLARNDRGFSERAAFFESLRDEPALAFVKLIAEPWDLGPGGYALGRFPRGWSEWNDQYRDTMRSFWKGDAGRIGEFAERIAGSSDLFRHRSRKPSASVNFVTAHDGFTLRDLVTYDAPRNEANKASGPDGTLNNLSWNCGVEGETADAQVNALRLKQMKNFIATLLCSQGVPMLVAGDEFARTQGGNNNAYCQDNSISWIDWGDAGRHGELLDFVRKVSALRKRRIEFRRDTFFKGRVQGQSSDVLWLNARALEMSIEEWQYRGCSAIAIQLAGVAPEGDLLLLVNAERTAVEFKLPELHSGVWQLAFDTSLCDAPPLISNAFRLESHAMALLEAR